MTKTETMQHLPTSEQVQAAAQDLKQLPQAIVEHLTPILPNIELAMEAQRRTIETLTAQAVQRIEQTQAQALQAIQAQQQTSERALTGALTRLTQQSSALQTLPGKTKEAAAQAMQAAQEMQDAISNRPPLTLTQGIVLMVCGAILAAALTLAGMRAFDAPAPQNGQQQAQQQTQQQQQ
ncbi:MAG: hypothetical protein AB7S53_07245 [Thiomonas sp.]|jgi:hypothetical protein